MTRVAPRQSATELAIVHVVADAVAARRRRRLSRRATGGGGGWMISARTKERNQKRDAREKGNCTHSRTARVYLLHILTTVAGESVIKSVKWRSIVRQRRINRSIGRSIHRSIDRSAPNRRAREKRDYHDACRWCLRLRGG